MKGALVVVSSSLAPQAIAFQYNPHTLTRQLTARRVDAERGPTRLTGAPEETISLEVEIDAVDQIGDGDKQAAAMGIHPQLAALEMLLYPSSSHLVQTAALLHAGTIEIIPPPTPTVLLVWGASRVLPVDLSELSITEEAFDADLNPLRARASLGLRVLSYGDLAQSNPSYHLFLSHHVVKETMAHLARTNELPGQSLDDIVSGGV
ncbi:MAG: hypothetical protein ACOC9W_01810 [Persicimonas sp.]